MSSFENIIEFIENMHKYYSSEYYIPAPNTFEIAEALKKQQVERQDNTELIKQLKLWEGTSWDNNLTWLYMDFIRETGKSNNTVFSIYTIIEFLK